METVSRLIGLSQPGTASGRCAICAGLTRAGWRQSPSDTFTAWAQLYAGEVICEYCWALLKDRRVRAHSWLATPGHIRFVEGDRSWFWDALQAPPEGPFAIYVTVGRQKQGWVAGARYVAQSRERYPVMTDWLDRPLWMDRAYVVDHAPLLARLRARGLSRRALLEGPGPVIFARALREGWSSDLAAVLLSRRDPRWEVCVYAVP
jgi:hypothetical protein